MSYAAPAGEQMLSLAVFLATGFLLGLLFELLRFLRRLFAGEGTAAVRVQDILLCVLSFFVLFFAFLAYGDGRLRLHLLLSSAVGFLVFRLFPGSLLRLLLDRCSAAIKKSVYCLLRPFATAAKKICAANAAARKLFVRCKNKLRLFLRPRPKKKLRKNRKKGLKKQEKSV